MPSDHEDDEFDEDEFGSNEDFLREHGLDPDDEDLEFIPDPLAKARWIEAQTKKIRKVLVEQYGFDEDEFDTLFKTPQDLFNYYQEQRRGMHTADGEAMRAEVDAEANEGDEPEDDFELDDVATQNYLNRSVVPAKQGGKTAAIEDASKKKKAAPKKKPRKKK